MTDGRIESVTDFLQELSHLRKIHVWEMRDEVSSLTFYRGQADETWTLAPRLYREKLHLEEQNIISDALRLLPDEFSGNSKIRMLAKMQHYGLPTRLLDVTSNPLVALYFACLNHEEKDGTVYIFANLPTFGERGYMVPITMQFAFEERWIGMCLQDFAAAAQHYFPTAPRDEDEAMRSVMNALCLDHVAVLSPHDNARLQAQSGAFLLFGMVEESRRVSGNPGNRGKCYVDFQPAEVVGGIGLSTEGSRVPEGGLRLTVPASAKAQILNELDHLDVNQWRLFPGVQGTLGYVYDSYVNGRRYGPHSALPHLEGRSLKRLP